MTTALIPIADGVEEMEAVIVIDVLRRAEWDVTVVALREPEVTASRGVRLLADTVWSKIAPAQFDWIILPGGAVGTQKLMADDRVIAALQEHARAGKPIGAICAAPTVLHAAGLLRGRSFTSHPSVAARFGDNKRSDERVVVDGNFITSQGPGTSFEFALAIVARQDGVEKARRLAEQMLCSATP